MTSRLGVVTVLFSILWDRILFPNLVKVFRYKCRRDENGLPRFSSLRLLCQRTTPETPQNPAAEALRNLANSAL